MMIDFSTMAQKRPKDLNNRTSQEEGFARRLSNPSSGGGKPLFLTCSISALVKK